MPDEKIKRPAYQWYPADANGDEVFRLMTYEQQGIYRALLDHQWVEGSIPAEPKLVFSLLPKLKSYDRFQKLWPLIAGKFRTRDGDRLVNDRLESQRRELDAYVETQTVNGAKGAEKRWKRHGTAIATPLANDSSSSSTSTTTTTTTTGKEGERTPPATRIPTSIFQPHEHRNHACCGVVCLHSSLFSEFERKARAEADPDAYVRQFFAGWNERYQRGDRATDKIAEDQFDFWRKRWAESHPPAVSQVNTAGVKTAAAAGRVAQLLREAK